MITRLGLLSMVFALLLVGVAATQFPILDMMVNNVTQKYQQATCEQLWV